MVALTLFFLKKDDLRFGKFFLLAAVMCGFATATKLIGAYFFLAVALTLLAGLILKKASLRKLILMALAFLAVMAVSFVVANPFLLSHWAREAYYNTVIKQSDLLSLGYGVIYEKGLLASYPVVHQFYGEWIFLLTALAVAIWSAWRGPQRWLIGLILAWFAPVSVSIFWFTHFKFQYWLPAVLPLFSCLIVLLPVSWTFDLRNLSLKRILSAIALLVVAGQFALFLFADLPNFDARLHRAENNARISFYNETLKSLSPLPSGDRHVYFDYRLYLPDTPGWGIETNFELLDYAYLQEKNFDVLLLLQQRIRDYLNPDVTGIDPAHFALNQQFYRDADQGAIHGYRLVYRNSVGLVYVRDDLFQRYFSNR